MREDGSLLTACGTCWIVGGTLARLLSLIGIGLQLLGAACVAGSGFRSLGRQALFDPTRAVIGRTWRRLTDPLLRWIGKAPPRVAQVRAATDVAFAIDSARVSRGFAPLADDLSDADKIAELDRRIQEITADTGRLASQLIERVEAQDRQQKDSSREFHGYAGEQAVQDRERAVRELRVQALGLFLVTAGSCLQAVGSLLPSENNLTSTGTGCV
jgi:hypothetical protein